MSKRSAAWSAAAFTVIAVLIFGAVLFRAGDAAGSGSQTETVVASDTSQPLTVFDDTSSSGPYYADEGGSYEDGSEHDGESHDDEHDSEEHDD